jgi:hypothetical protein
VHIRLGTGICILPQRNPVHAARQAADVDYLSRGPLDYLSRGPLGYLSRGPLDFGLGTG